MKITDVDLNSIESMFSKFDSILTSEQKAKLDRHNMIWMTNTHHVHTYMRGLMMKLQNSAEVTEQQFQDVESNHRHFRHCVENMENEARAAADSNHHFQKHQDERQKRMEKLEVELQKTQGQVQHLQTALEKRSSSSAND
ncbi:hypothetical protein BKA67DRAFT_529071 [Truncatella angustata]|uniref:Uncharacterized protein n=1 Tax=Truncatella angustata TaxID=152316 RepID=A0A9P9A346_9PEZI|nr:uncharacterized protein BKA67DRAFT_529071 [Truncatella angustata]KAH6658880.1 hypothetical protein BKA67DRAFT_529071 [Truncatella angustata]KAH8197206.1 hypothetical protein TruAng_008623 [Truncatella angustata]